MTVNFFISFKNSFLKQFHRSCTFNLIFYSLLIILYNTTLYLLNSEFVSSLDLGISWWGRDYSFIIIIIIF